MQGNYGWLFRNRIGVEDIKYSCVHRFLLMDEYEIHELCENKRLRKDGRKLCRLQIVFGQPVLQKFADSSNCLPPMRRFVGFWKAVICRR